MIKVLFVCLENICRSPMAQFVFKQMVEERGLSDRFEIDSAATESYNEMCHAGIHYGTREILKSMHVPFEEHYSCRIRPRDYVYYDYILAMDDSNIEDILEIVGPDTEHKIHRLLDFTDHPRNIHAPLNIILNGMFHDFKELNTLGVRRLSVGSGPVRYICEKTIEIAQELYNGNVDNILKSGLTYAKANEYFKK